jgi:hypothetical protein
VVFAIVNVIVVKHLGGVALLHGAAAARRLFEHPRTGHGAVHALRLSGAARGGDSAGGERRGDRADAAPAQGRQAAGHREQVAVRARDRVRVVKMASEKRP